jgi:hypothetical protein
MMKYLIFATTALFAAQCALAQTTAPAEPTKPAATEPAKPAVTQPAPAAAAKNVGTNDKTGAAQSYLKAQEKKKAAAARKQAAKGPDAKPAADVKSADADAVRPGSVMTDEERTAHRKKLQSFKTLDECEKYQKDYVAKVEARAKEQNKKLRPFNEAACNRYKVAAEKAAQPAPAAAAAGKPAPK